MKARHSVHLAVVASLALLGGCDALISTDKRIARIEDALATGQLGKASIELRKLVDKEPDSPRARVLLARLALRAGDVSGAQAELDRASKAGATPAEVQPLQVQAMLQSGRAADAITLLEKDATTIAQPARGNLLGRALLGAGRARDAVAAFDAALAADPKHGPALAGRADALAAAGDADAALAAADQALAADAANWEASLVKGRLLGSRGDAKGGEAQLREALSHMSAGATVSQVATVRASVLEIALSEGRLDDAQKDLQSLQQLVPDAPMTQLLGARVALAKGDRRDAISRLQKAVAGAPNLVPARLLLGGTQAQEGNLLQAEEEFRKVLEQDPGNVEAVRQLAQVRLALGDAEGARKAVLPALDAGQTDPRLLTIMAAEGGETGRRESLESVQRSYNANPSNPALRLALAQALLRNQRAADAAKLLETPEPVGQPGVYWPLRLTALVGARGAPAAMTEIDRLIAARPKDAALVQAAAGVLLRSGQEAKAEELLRKALQLSPEATDVRLVLADRQSAHGDVEGAIALLRAAPDAEKNAPLQLGIGTIELSRGGLAAAQAAFDRAIAAAPGRPEVIGQAGALLNRFRQYEAALERFQKAGEMAPKAAAYALGETRSLLELGRPAEARKAAQRAAEAEPASISPVSALVAIDLREKKNDEAVRRAREWRSAHGEDDAAGLLLAETLARSGDSAGAGKVLTEMQQQHPSADGALRLYQLRRSSGSAEPARPLQDWLAQHADDHRVRAALGSFYSETGNWAGAAAELERVSAAFPRDAVTLNNLAWVYQQQKDKRALPTAEKAYALAAGSPLVADTYGYILFEQGQAARALPILEQAAKAMPDHPDIQVHYGTALARAGKAAEARPVLERALALQKDPAVRGDIQKQLDALGGSR